MTSPLLLSELKEAQWLTQHADCAIEYRDTKVGKGEPRKERPSTKELIP